MTLVEENCIEDVLLNHIKEDADTDMYYNSEFDDFIDAFIEVDDDEYRERYKHGKHHDHDDDDEEYKHHHKHHHHDDEEDDDEEDDDDDDYGEYENEEEACRRVYEATSQIEKDELELDLADWDFHDTIDMILGIDEAKGGKC